MAVGVIGKNFFQNETLDLAKRPAGGDIIGVNEVLDTVRPVYLRSRSDEVGAEMADEVGLCAQVFAEARKRADIGLRQGTDGDLHGGSPNSDVAMNLIGSLRENFTCFLSFSDVFVSYDR
jgi:hypothetical protein